jgi:hypothetical protein
VLVNGLAFGVAHLANAQFLVATFAVGQAVSATLLGVVPG